MSPNTPNRDPAPGGTATAAWRDAEQLLASLPEPHVVDGARAQIARSLAATGTKIAIIDDDPTGTQVVSGLPMVAEWTDETLDWAIQKADTAFVVLTNSRSLDVEAAIEVNAEIGRRIAQRAAALGIDVRCISRSDSTLRGHFPEEVRALVGGLRAGGQEIDGVLLSPAFFPAGRITVDDVHYIRDDDQLVPVAETEFAKDAVFGYTTSNLCEWAVSRGVDRDSIVNLDLRVLRAGGPAAVAAELLGHRGRLIVANAVEEADLDVLVLGVIEAERQGLRLVYRSAPSFVGARIGQRLRRALSVFELAPAVGPGLLVVGSHLELTSRQLVQARQEHMIEVVELQVDRLDDDGAEVQACSAALTAALRHGDAALVTSRDVLSDSDGNQLGVGRRVAQALVDVVSSIPSSQPLGWVVVKGGLTSSEIATKAFEAKSSLVVGQIFPGMVSVLRLGPTSKRPGIPFVVFPGNVGNDRALAVTLSRLKGL
jgi:uncharacterized protein YgbK (DUF1537 family)